MSRSLPPRLLAALVAVTDRLNLAGVEWLLAGSAARALAGFAARPADLDIEISPHSDPAAPEALGLVLHYGEGNGHASWRAIGMVAGAEVDLTSALEVDGPGGRLAPDFPLQRTWATWATVAGRRVPLAPVEETLARAIVRADWAALARLAAEGAGAVGAAQTPRGTSPAGLDSQTPRGTSPAGLDSQTPRGTSPAGLTMVPAPALRSAYLSLRLAAASRAAR